MTQQRADYPLDYGKSPPETTQDRLRDLADTASDQVRAATENVQELAGKVADQARVYGEKAQEAARNVKPMMESSLKEQPMATLAAVAAIGFVLGALWKK